VPTLVSGKSATSAQTCVETSFDTAGTSARATSAGDYLA